MSDAGDNQVAAIDHTDSDESLVLMTSSLPAVSFVQETPGDLFDAPNGTALIRENPSFSDCLFFFFFKKKEILTNLINVDACNCQGAWGAGIARAFRERVSRSITHLMRQSRANKTMFFFSIPPPTKSIATTVSFIAATQSPTPSPTYATRTRSPLSLSTVPLVPHS